MDIDSIKSLISKKAAEAVVSKTVVGLGTGTTISFFLEHLGQRCKEGLSIKAVSSSTATSKQAKALRIPLVETDAIDKIDLMVDGADQIDHNKNLVKGRGGALVREKILASFSQKIIILVDETKRAQSLGAIHVPLEVLPFGSNITQKLLGKRGYKAVFRESKNKKMQSDNGNFLMDIYFDKPIENPQQLSIDLKEIPGIVETGLFYNLPMTVYVGKSDGSIEIL